MKSSPIPKVSIILNIPASKNPMLRMFLRSLKEDFRISVIAPDAYNEKEDFTSVVFHKPGKIQEQVGKIVGYWPLRALHKSLLFFISAKKIKKRKSLNDFFGALYFWHNNSWMCIFHFFTLLFNKKPSIVIVIDGGALSAARWYKRWNSVPFVYSVYEVYPDQFANSGKLLRKMMRCIEFKGCKKMNGLFVPVEEVFATLLRRRYNLKNKYKVIALSVCPEISEKMSRPKCFYPIKLYYHGIFMEDRGLQSLIKSMKSIDKQKGHLYLRGFGPLLPELKNLVFENELEDKVTILEPVPSNMLSKAATEFDVGITMAVDNTLNGRFVIGFKTIENIAAGLVILGPDSFALHNFINRNQVGKTFSYRNMEQSIGDSIQFIIGDLSKIELWKKNSRLESKRVYNFDWQKNKLLETLNKML